jgi:hypothetical protein
MGLLVRLIYGFLARVAHRFLWQCDDCDDISERLRVAMAGAVPATN